MKTSIRRCAPQLRSARAARPPVLVLALIAALCIPTLAGASDSDYEIEVAAKQTYVFRTFLSDDPIRADAQDGVVTLSGSVKQDSHRLLAEHTVSGLPNVRSVNNQLKVKEAPADSPDTWLHLKVKGTLAFHRSVSALSTDVAVREGVVTLKGKAASQAERELATEFARDVDGVKSVNNEMTLAEPGPAPRNDLADRIDDASITAQVRMALFSHRSTSGLMASVSTTQGVVTVGGNASNAAERDLVTKLVKDINGVQSVVNEMTLPTALSTTL